MSDGDTIDSVGLPALEQQIVERMSKLQAAAEEFYKLQILLDAIDGRDVLPVPDYLVDLVPPVSLPDERRRRQARYRSAQRLTLVRPPGRRAR